MQGVAATSNGSPEMSQYYHSSDNADPYGAGVQRGPSTADTSSTGGYAGLGAGAGFAGVGAHVFPSAAATGRTAKQQEAWREQQQFHVQNPGEGGGSGGPITVHTDGGAFNEVDASGHEIPPT